MDNLTVGKLGYSVPVECAIAMKEVEKKRRRVLATNLWLRNCHISAIIAATARGVSLSSVVITVVYNFLSRFGGPS